jgi:hypothetical protein
VSQGVTRGARRVPRASVQEVGRRRTFRTGTRGAPSVSQGVTRGAQGVSTASVQEVGRRRTFRTGTRGAPSVSQSVTRGARGASTAPVQEVRRRRTSRTGTRGTSRASRGAPCASRGAPWESRGAPRASRATPRASRAAPWASRRTPGASPGEARGSVQEVGRRRTSRIGFRGVHGASQEKGGSFLPASRARRRDWRVTAPERQAALSDAFGAELRRTRRLERSTREHQDGRTAGRCGTGTRAAWPRAAVASVRGGERIRPTRVVTFESRLDVRRPPASRSTSSIEN